MKKGKKILHTALICICAAAFLFSGYKIAETLLAYKKADNFYSDLNDRYITEINNSDPAVTDPGNSRVQIDFNRLLSDYPDIVGWLLCEGTVMNYPVVQTSDNEYYLRRDLNGNYLVTGTIFADFRCTRPGEDPCYLIFGHNMNNGTIFGMLKNYRDPAYLAEHPTYSYLTPDKDYTVEVLAAATTTTADSIYDIGNEREGFTEHIREFCRSAGRDPSIAEGDRFIVLSTCTDGNSDERLILIGRIMEGR